MAGQQTPEARVQRAAAGAGQAPRPVDPIDDRSHLVILKDTLNELHNILSNAENEVDGLHRDLYACEPEDEITTTGGVEVEKKTWPINELIEEARRAVARVDRIRNHASTTRMKLTGADSG